MENNTKITDNLVTGTYCVLELLVQLPELHIAQPTGLYKDGQPKTSCLLCSPGFGKVLAYKGILTVLKS